MRKGSNNLLEENNICPISYRLSAVDLPTFVPSRLFRISRQNVFPPLLVVMPFLLYISLSLCIYR